MNYSISHEWANFYIDVVMYDEFGITFEGDLVNDPNITKNLKSLVADALVFGHLMEQVMLNAKNEDGKLRFTYQKPCGTEDRTFVRTFNSLKYPKGEYAGFISFQSGDWYAIANAVHLFMVHSTTRIF
jgi:hypothetical protein